MAKQKQVSASKHTPTYWKEKIRKLNRRGSLTPNFYQTIQFNGERRTVSLGTGNKSIAASKAAENWQTLQAGGWEAIFPVKKKDEFSKMSVTQFLEVARKRAELRGTRSDSIKDYENKLRVIVAGILDVTIDTHKKWDSGEREVAKRKVYGAKIERVLTAANIDRFKAEYLRRRLQNGDDEKRIKRTFNSYLRGGNALFSKETLEEISGASNPFTDVQGWPKCSKKFKSVIPDFDKLIDDFNEKFAAPQKEGEKDLDFVLRREVFKNFVIILATGARRGEADRLKWSNIDIDRGLCCFDGHLKTENSEATIPLNPESLEILRKFRDESPDDLFYLKRGKQRRYEAGATSERLMKWLREYEIEDGSKPLTFKNTPKPIHYLRAEVGNRHWNQFQDAAMAASYLRDDLQTFLSFYGDAYRARKAPTFGVAPRQSDEANRAENIRRQLAELEKELVALEN